MSAQLSLPLRDYPGEARRFVRDNPEWWALVKREARIAVAERRHFGMKALVEWSRFEVGRRAIARPGVVYRINNNWASTFSRLLVAEYPEVEPYIDMRATHA